MRDREIRIVEDVLRRLRPRHCLEWGAGHSTLYFTRHLSRGASWLSVEHDAEWFRAVRRQLGRRPCFSRQGPSERYDFHLRDRWQHVARPVIEPLSRAADLVLGGSNVNLVHVPPNQFPWSDADGDGTYEDLIDYVEYPGRSAPFGFILVDGRARRACLLKAHSLLTDDGVVVLHDAGRRYYHDSFAPYESQILLRDDREDEIGLWIGRKHSTSEWSATLSAIRAMWQQSEW